MLDLYTWRTPNGKKPVILLEELGSPYELHLLDLSKGEQKQPKYLAINPNGKIPALVDREGTPDAPGPITVFESGAVLVYLAEKAGRFLPKRGQERADVLSWTFWQVGGPGPMFGQLASFARQKPRNDAAYEKFLAESTRLADVLEGRLATHEHVAGAYSIADMMIYPWFEAVSHIAPPVLEGRDAVRRWMSRVGDRPAVRKAMGI